MASEIRNLPLAEAERQLAEKVAPRTTLQEGSVRSEDESAARAELARLEALQVLPEAGDNR